MLMAAHADTFSFYSSLFCYLGYVQIPQQAASAQYRKSTKDGYGKGCRSYPIGPNTQYIGFWSVL